MAENTSDPVTEFGQQPGPDFDFLSDRLGLAVQRLTDAVVQTKLDQAITPVKTAHEALTTREIEREVGEEMRIFEERHPDWKEHEAAMLELGDKVRPAGMAAHEYLAHLYAAVTRDRTVTSTATATRERDTRESNARESEPASTPPARPTIHEAFLAAKRGERWD